jgi:3-oxoadipate enol-lactonase
MMPGAMVHAREYDVDGRRLRYLEAGAGRLLVLLHAFPLSADQWQPQLADPPQGWRVVAPDLRGFRGREAAGWDRSPVGSVTVDHYAADIVALLDHLGAERAVIGGLSMGGYVAFGVLRIAPARVAGLVLADTRPEADSQEARRRREQMLARLASGGPPAVADDLLPSLLGPTTLGKRPGVVARVRALIEGNTADAIAAAIGALMQRPDATPLLPTIAVPTLVVVGEEDTVTPPPVAAAMQRAIPSAELVVVPEAGHLSNLEQPALFAAALEAFLQRCAR